MSTTQASKGGNGHSKALHFTHPPRRVVSLVPSMTESLCDLGMGESLVGITDYCIHPAASLTNLPRLGGPQNPRVDEIIALKPDLILANWEENTRSSVEQLEAAGLAVWVTFPKTVADSMELLWTLVSLYRSQTAKIRLQTLEVTLDWTTAAAEERPPVRFFCPIWQQQTSDQPIWWMTFNRFTYCHDLLSLLGGVNIFASRERRYPLQADLGLQDPIDPQGADTRYPRVTQTEILAAAPELILLPDDPFQFSEAHRLQLCDLLADTPAVKNDRVLRVDGSLITWHGTRLALALRELPALLDSVGTV